MRGFTNFGSVKGGQHVYVNGEEVVVRHGEETVFGNRSSKKSDNGSLDDDFGRDVADAFEKAFGRKPW
ncbi:hypothetical protein AB0A70_04185 [Streptomyces morookaense]|uniref:hypothetical protein n=1 Tax=Streptomyces morookaense TaxID=1970 RepID=UPI0033CA4844